MKPLALQKACPGLAVGAAEWEAGGRPGGSAGAPLLQAEGVGRGGRLQGWSPASLQILTNNVTGLVALK